MIGELLQNSLDLYLDAAPWLLLGLIAAGLLKAWLPEGALNRWLGGSGPWPVIKAALVGAPLPLCSCGVLPAALGLRRSGASRQATVSFLIATPETGVDSIAVSYAMLGPVMAVVRPIAAILSAIVTGLLTTLVPQSGPVPVALNIATASCSGGSCCSSGCSRPPARSGVFATTLQGLQYASTDILDDISVWLGIGILLAGAVATWVPQEALIQWGSGLPAMGLMLLIGIPMYICATASTPVAAALLLAGISPGTVLVFLLAGPATNLATLAVLRKELGKRVLIAYLAGITLSSVGLGLLLDYLLETSELNITAQLGAGGEFLPQWLAWTSGVILVVLALKPIRRKIIGK